MIKIAIKYFVYRLNITNERRMIIVLISKIMIFLFKICVPNFKPQIVRFYFFYFLVKTLIKQLIKSLENQTNNYAVILNHSGKETLYDFINNLLFSILLVLSGKL